MWPQNFKNTYSLRKMYLTIIMFTLKHIYQNMAIIMSFIDTKPIHDYKYKWFNWRGFRYGSVPKKIAPQMWSICYFQCQSSQWFLIKNAHAYKSKRNPQALISQLFPETHRNTHNCLLNSNKNTRTMIKIMIIVKCNIHINFICK